MGLLSGTASGSTKIGLLGFKRQKSALEKKVIAQKRALAELEVKRHRKKRQLEEATSDLEQQQALLYQLEKETIGLSHECEQCQREIQRREQIVELIEAEIKDLVKEETSLTDQLEDLERKLSDNSAAQTKVQEELGTARAELHRLRTEQQAAQEKLNTITADKKVLNERRLALEQTFRRVDEQKTQAKSRLGSLRVRQAKNEGRIEELTQALEDLAVEAQRLSSEAEEVDSQLAGMQQELEEWKESYKSIETGLVDLRSRREMTLEERSGIEVELARIQTQLQNLENHCQEQLHCSLTEISQDTEVEEIEHDTICHRYEELRERLDKFGPINMAALGEYQENEKRHIFLTQQREDIEVSIADTSKTIQEINRRSRKQFSETFTAINKNFNKVFQKLFGGGSCGMELLDQEDVLECGIDLYAQPPGKKLQNVMLLSGGEKALTVFSLLVAIFMFRPSRFCLLDEVDAPLDDANVKRFGELIEEMSHQTQFIIVTHNKSTMEMSDTLYGITMEEPGVSKMVSVRF
jgi:chromosome segregation protein